MIEGDYVLYVPLQREGGSHRDWCTYLSHTEKKGVSVARHVDQAQFYPLCKSKISHHSFLMSQIAKSPAVVVAHLPSQ